LYFNEDTVALVLNGEPGIEQILRLAIAEPDGLVNATPVIDRAIAWWWQINFYVGNKFATQNTLLHSRSGLGIVVTGESEADYHLETELNLWEYAGSFRFDLSGSGFRPYLKAGYGWTWYRAENSTFDGEPLFNPNGEWINRPSFDSFSSILPNSWHAGAGLEIIGHRSRAPFPQGIDVSLVGEVNYTSTSLGVDDWLLVSGSGSPKDGLIENLSFHRWTWSLGLTLGF
jgi:hypothetical protein